MSHHAGISYDDGRADHARVQLRHVVALVLFLSEIAYTHGDSRYRARDFAPNATKAGLALEASVACTERLPPWRLASAGVLQLESLFSHGLRRSRRPTILLMGSPQGRPSAFLAASNCTECDESHGHKRHLANLLQRYRFGSIRAIWQPAIGFKLRIVHRFRHIYSKTPLNGVSHAAHIVKSTNNRAVPPLAPARRAWSKNALRHASASVHLG